MEFLVTSKVARMEPRVGRGWVFYFCAEETAEDLFEVPCDVKVARMELRVGTKLYWPLLCCVGFLTTARRLL